MRVVLRFALLLVLVGCAADGRRSVPSDPVAEPSTPAPSTPSTPATDCGDAFDIGSNNPEDAARAMGICNFVSARFTDANGVASPLSMMQIGLVPDFGTLIPPQGSTMLAISSGVARTPSQAGYTRECDYFDLEDGPSAGSYAPVTTRSDCAMGSDTAPIFDSVALEVVVQVPAGATGFKFKSSFFTYEYPDYICNDYNDFFVALRSRPDGSFENVVFDQSGNAVSVNNSLLEVCEPGTHGGKTFACPQGTSLLAGTGFGGTAYCGGLGDEGFDDWGDGPFGDMLSDEALPGGSTGWLETIVPANAGETLTLRFAIWDAGDSDLDSTALLDAFEWTGDPVAEGPTTMHSPLI